MQAHGIATVALGDPSPVEVLADHIRSAYREPRPRHDFRLRGVEGTRALQGPLWQSLIANGRLVEWHFLSDANHGFRHPDSDGYQPHYADLVWPLVTSFLERTV